jgi:hypothetical protein
MQRTYTQGTSTSAAFFVGTEIEQTAYFGHKTLFIVGVQSIDQIQTLADQNSVTHLFFGANHSFQPNTSIEAERRTKIIKHFLDLGWACSLDVLPQHLEYCTELFGYQNFCGQIRVPIPNVLKLNTKTMLKIDDVDFNATNPGIWTHRIVDLVKDEVFTDWAQYTNDQIV